MENIYSYQPDTTSIIIILVVIMLFVICYTNRHHRHHKIEKFSSSFTYSYLGPFNDSNTRMISLYIPNVVITSVEQAQTIANSYNAPVFGIQNGTDLYIGYNISSAISLGHALCPHTLGCSLINQVYVAGQNYTYNLIGAYNDGAPKCVPIQVSKVTSVAQAQQIANSYGATVFGIQNNGDLMIGYDIRLAISLGITTSSNVLGDQGINQLYVAINPKNYTYISIGPYIDNNSRVIPIQIPNVVITSVAQAKTLASSYGAHVFGIQDGSQLFIGYDIALAQSLGTTVCSNNLGGPYINQVYVAAF